VFTFATRTLVRECSGAENQSRLTLPISARQSTDAAARPHESSRSTLLTTWTWFQHFATEVRRRPGTELRSPRVLNGRRLGRWGSAKLHAALHVLLDSSSSHSASGLAAKPSDSCACHLRMRNGACRAALRAAASRVFENREAEGPVPHPGSLFFCFGSSSRTLQGWERPLQPVTGPPPSSAVLSVADQTTGDPDSPDLAAFGPRRVTALAQKNVREAPISLPLRAYSKDRFGLLLCSVCDAGPASLDLANAAKPACKICACPPVSRRCVPLESLETSSL
jgi:hypothetical protein